MRAIGRSRVVSGVTLLGIMLLVLVASLPVVPTLTIQPRDSSIFAYFSYAVMHGATPYKDVFDHKAPGVFTMDLLAFGLLGANRWAIWIMTTLNTLAFASVFYALARRLAFTRAVAWIATICVVLTARHSAIAHDGNFSEPYALLPIVLCIWFGYELLANPQPRWALLIGVTAAWIFMLRQTSVGVPLMLLPALLLSQPDALRQRAWWKRAGLMIAGGVGTLTCVALYFGVRGAFADLRVAMWDFNLIFTDAVQDSFFEALLSGLQNDTVVRLLGPTVPLTIWGAVIAVTRVRRTGTETDSAEIARRTVFFWLVLSLGVNLLLANISRHGWEHYYLIVLPELALLAGLALNTPLVCCPRAMNLTRFGVAVYWLLIVVVMFAAGSVAGFLNAEGTLFGAYDPDPVAAFITSETGPDDMVYVWSRSGLVNFQARRQSPVKHYMGNHLLYSDYAGGAIIAEEVERLEAERPVMVIDMSALEDLPAINSDDNQRRSWRDIRHMAPLLEFVSAHCVPDTSAPFEVITVYRCTYGE